MQSIQLPSTKANGVYRGQALLSFVNAMTYSAPITKVLQSIGIEEIQADHWYDLDTARKLYFGIEQLIGRNSLMQTGQKIIENADFPTNLANVHDLLAGIQSAYTATVKGEFIGEIEHFRTGDRSAKMVFSTPFPCHLDQGIIQGCVMRFASFPKILHGEELCRDHGGNRCTYEVSWL